jgi:hypothetical protein
MTRTPRLVTVCIGKSIAEQYRPEGRRTDLLLNLIERIDRQWDHLDAIVFPGGYLRLNEDIGALPHAQRVSRLGGFEECLRRAVASIRRSLGVKIVTGIDGPGLRDQMCVAWDKSGVVGIGRKVFPVGKGDDPEKHHLVCYQSDYGSFHRVISLPCGRRAILCACYDMFGVAEKVAETVRTKSILRISCDDGVEYRRDNNVPRSQRVPWNEFHQVRTECIRQWNELLRTQEVSIGIAAIHEFRSHSTIYWQKHGIACCSAALGQGFAVGAAHFPGGLPKNDQASTLAACRVPKKHLDQGPRAVTTAGSQQSSSVQMKHSCGYTLRLEGWRDRIGQDFS